MRKFSPQDAFGGLGQRPLIVGNPAVVEPEPDVDQRRRPKDRKRGPPRSPGNGLRLSSFVPFARDRTSRGSPLRDWRATMRGHAVSIRPTSGTVKLRWGSIQVGLKR